MSKVAVKITAPFGPLTSTVLPGRRLPSVSTMMIVRLWPGATEPSPGLTWRPSLAVALNVPERPPLLVTKISNLPPRGTTQLGLHDDEADRAAGGGGVVVVDFGGGGAGGCGAALD
jgi:hypothetical protein